MGGLPLCYQAGDAVESLGLDSSETFDIETLDSLELCQDIRVKACKLDGLVVEFSTVCRVDTPVGGGDIA